MTDDQARTPASNERVSGQRTWRAPPFAYAGVLLVVFIGTWLAALAAADPARAGRLLIFLLGVLVGTLWAVRARIPVLNSPNQAVAALAWTGLALASIVGVSAAPVPAAERGAASAAGGASAALRPAPPTAVRREGTIVPVGTPRPTVAGSPVRATPRPPRTATPAAVGVAPNPIEPAPSTPAPSTPESSVPKPGEAAPGDPDQAAREPTVGDQPGAPEPATPDAQPTATSALPPQPSSGAPTRPTGSPTRPSSAPAPGPLPADFDPSRYLGQGNRFECSDIPSQAEAQAVLRADPIDPNVLDRDRDGIACETNPPPRDTRRVQRPAP